MFIWDTDVAAIIQRAVTGAVTGIFNVAGDGAMTVDDIAAALGKRTLTLPEPLLRRRARDRQRMRLTAYGPEQTKFLQFRPVLDNTRLKNTFGYVPSYTSARGVRGLASSAFLGRTGILITCAQSGKVPSPSAWSASR